MRALARRGTPLTETDIRQLHHLVVRRSHPEIAGRYASQARYVLTDTGRHNFPSPAEVPALMGDLGRWLAVAPDTPEAAFSAHYRILEVHPFEDGNGRTGRLLMNLILIRAGYPPIAVRPEDRPAYIGALQEAQGESGLERLDRLLYERLDATLAEYLSAAHQAWPAPTPPKP